MHLLYSESTAKFYTPEVASLQTNRECGILFFTEGMNAMREIIVSAAAEGKRLDRFLAAELPALH